MSQLSFSIVIIFIVFISEILHRASTFSLPSFGAAVVSKITVGMLHAAHEGDIVMNVLRGDALQVFSDVFPAVCCWPGNFEVHGAGKGWSSSQTCKRFHCFHAKCLRERVHSANSKLPGGVHLQASGQPFAFSFAFAARMFMPAGASVLARSTI